MTCSFFDVGCHLTDWFGWLLIPTWWHVIAGLIVGSVLGARFGWLAPISLGLSVLVPVLLGRRKEPEPEPDGPDFMPPFSPFGRQPKRENPKPRVGRKPGETAADRWVTK
jgi:hypothetical protein